MTRRGLFAWLAGFIGAAFAAKSAMADDAEDEPVEVEIIPVWDTVFTGIKSCTIDYYYTPCANGWECRTIVT